MRRAAPWYLHPLESPAAWERLRTGEAGLAFAVVNVANGPGTGVDDGYRHALTDVRTPLVGYVDVAYGHRSSDSVLADLAAWQEQYAVTAVMLDQVPPLASGHWHPGVIDRLRSSGATAVVVNPGCPASAELILQADVTCLAEMAWSTYARHNRGPAGVDPARVWHLIHSCPRARQPEAVARAEASGAGLCWTTAGEPPNPWRTLPESW